MSRTVTALFDTRADAEAGRERLLAADIDADNVRIHDNASMSGATSSTLSTSSSYSTTQEPGIWGSIKNAFLPDEDRHTYEEGVRRGGFLLTADVDEDEVDEAVAALENANSVDIDERSQGWRNEGWTAPAAGAAPAFFDNDAKPATMGGTNAMNEEVVPVIEEQLVVGKREVERGGVRVRSYVTEKPVHEQIRLRDEKVNVERRPVDRDLTDGDSDAFRERTIEMTETDEEAVVGKKARIVEEVVVSKSVDERVEDINETVRRTDVEVENLGTTGTSTARDSAYGEPAKSGTGSTLSGLANEAIGTVKQGIGSVTGSDSLTQSGEAQERKGEAQQGKTPGSDY